MPHRTVSEPEGTLCRFVESHSTGPTYLFALHRDLVSHAVPAPALVDASHRTTVEVDASPYEDRATPNGCSPTIPENSLDKNDATHWLCTVDLLENKDEGCWIEYNFDENRVAMGIKFYRGAENVFKIKL